MMRSSLAMLPLLALVGWTLTAQPGAASDPGPAHDEKPAATKQAPASPTGNNPFLQATGPRDRGASTEPVVVYTNEDLERLYGGRLREDGTEIVTTESTRTASGAQDRKQPADGDPLAWLRERQREQAERDAAIAAAKAEVSRLEERVEQLEAGVLVTTNPLLPRRVAPKKPADDAESDLAENWDRLDQRGRVEGKRDQLQEARDELAAARAELNRIR